MPRRIRKQRALTYQDIMSLKPNPHKAYEVFDSRVEDLSVRVYPTGTKTYFLNHHIDGKTKRTRIGDPKLMRLSKARSIAIKTKTRTKLSTESAKIRLDDKGTQNIIQFRHEDIFSNITARYIKECLIKQRGLRERTWKRYNRIFCYYVLPRWKNRSIRDIKRSDIIILLDEVFRENGGNEANRVLASLRGLFNWSFYKKLIKAVPSFNKLQRKKLVRHRILSNEELVKFWEGCKKEKYPFGKLFQLLLITGQGVNEVTNMKWSQINLAERVWVVPRELTKHGRAHLVPLNQMAMDILEVMPKYADRDLLFPSQWDHDRPVGGLSKAKLRVANFEDWEISDLRSTVLTNLYLLDVEAHIASEVLSSKKQSAEAHNHYNYYKQKSEALDKWSDRLTNILENNVVVLDIKKI